MGAGGRHGAAVDQASGFRPLFTPPPGTGVACAPEPGSPVPTSHLLPQLIQLQLRPPTSPPVAFPANSTPRPDPATPYTAFCPPSNTALGHGHQNPLNPAPQLPPALCPASSLPRHHLWAQEPSITPPLGLHTGSGFSKAEPLRSSPPQRLVYSLTNTTALGWRVGGLGQAIHCTAPGSAGLPAQDGHLRNTSGVVWEGWAQWSASSPGPGPLGCGVGRKGSASASPCRPGETYKPESLVALQREPVHQVAGLVGAVRQDVSELSLGDQRHWRWKEVAEGCGLQPGACTCLSLFVRESTSGG